MTDARKILLKIPRCPANCIVEISKTRKLGETKLVK